MMKISSKIQLCIVSFGVIIGLVGILHGIAEILQGTKILTSTMLRALPENWPNSEFYELVDGQPAFSLITGIPFYLLGILAIIVSSLLILHSIFLREVLC